MSKSKFKRMGLNYQNDVMLCSGCRSIFLNRWRKRCPNCKILLVYPGERFCVDSEGYYFSDGKWKKISDLKKEIEFKTAKELVK